MRLREIHVPPSQREILPEALERDLESLDGRVVGDLLEEALHLSEKRGKILTVGVAQPLKTRNEGPTCFLAGLL